MTTSISRRRHNLNVAVLLLVVFMAMQAGILFPDLGSSPIVQAIVIISSKGLYELLVGAVFLAINSSAMLMHMYWGKLYLGGLWSYEYFLDGKRFIGVWDISQDADGVHIVGNGLDDRFRVRTIVRSVSPLIEEQGGYFILNARNELTHGNARVFSKTTLLLDRPAKPWRLVTSMHATTEVFGGPTDRQLHPDVIFTRHSSAESVDDVVAILKTEQSSMALEKPAGPAAPAASEDRSSTVQAGPAQVDQSRGVLPTAPLQPDD